MPASYWRKTRGNRLTDISYKWNFTFLRKNVFSITEHNGEKMEHSLRVRKEKDWIIRWKKRKTGLTVTIRTFCVEGLRRCIQTQQSVGFTWIFIGIVRVSCPINSQTMRHDTRTDHGRTGRGARGVTQKKNDLMLSS